MQNLNEISFPLLKGTKQDWDVARHCARYMTAEVVDELFVSGWKFREIRIVQPSYIIASHRHKLKVHLEIEKDVMWEKGFGRKKSQQAVKNIFSNNFSTMAPGAYLPF